MLKDRRSRGLSSTQNLGREPTGDVLVVLIFSSNRYTIIISIGIISSLLYILPLVG